MITVWRRILLSIVTIAAVVSISNVSLVAQKPEATLAATGEAQSITLAQGSRLPAGGLATAQSATSAPRAVREAEIVQVEGKVKAQLTPDRDWQEVKEPGLRLQEGASLRTYAGASCEVLIGASQGYDVYLKVEPRTRLTLTELIRRAESDRHTLMDISRGAVFAKTKGIDTDAKFQVDTPTSVIGVWGSAFRVEAGSGSTAFAVAEARQAQISGSAGAPLWIQPGTQANVGEDGRITVGGIPAAVMDVMNSAQQLAGRALYADSGPPAIASETREEPSSTQTETERSALPPNPPTGGSGNSSGGGAFAAFDSLGNLSNNSSNAFSPTTATIGADLLATTTPSSSEPPAGSSPPGCEEG